MQADISSSMQSFVLLLDAFLDACLCRRGHVVGLCRARSPQGTRQPLRALVQAGRLRLLHRLDRAVDPAHHSVHAVYGASRNLLLGGLEVLGANLAWLLCPVPAAVHFDVLKQVPHLLRRLLPAVWHPSGTQIDGLVLDNLPRLCLGVCGPFSVAHVVFSQCVELLHSPFVMKLVRHWRV